MKRISVYIKNGEVKLDFEGFAGETCTNEENVIRTLYGKMGVETNVKHSDNKRAAEANGAAERERNGN